jgi:hypothetical protein
MARKISFYWDGFNTFAALMKKKFEKCTKIFVLWVIMEISGESS